MNVEYFYTILQKSGDTKDIPHIEKLSRQYPYFSVSQMIYISLLRQTNDNEFNNALKTFSHNIPDRKYFFQHIKKSNKKTSSPVQPISTTENISIETTTTLSPPIVNEPAPLPIQDISKELNKSISESIVQTEILQINPNIQTKVNELQINPNTPTKVNEPIELSQTTNEEEQKKSPSVSIPPDKTKAPDTTNEDNDSENIVHSTTLSDALKRHIRQSHIQQSQNIPQEHQQENKKEKIKKQQEIIDRIISNPPKPSKTTQKFFSPENKAKESLLETEDLVTETLAQIYASQGNIYKAIRAYEILSLKFPQKNTYFAAKIEELKNQLKNKNQ